MSNVITRAEAEPTTDAKPSYWEWLRYLIDEWEPTGGEDKPAVVMFLLALAFDATNGEACFPGNDRIMRRCGRRRRWVQIQRKAARKAGLIRPGKYKGRSKVDGVQVWEISIPRGALQCAPDVHHSAPNTSKESTIEPSKTRGALQCTPTNLAIGIDSSAKAVTTAKDSPTVAEVVEVIFPDLDEMNEARKRMDELAEERANRPAPSVITCPEGKCDGSGLYFDGLANDFIPCRCNPDYDLAMQD